MHRCWSIERNHQIEAQAVNLFKCFLLQRYTITENDTTQRYSGSTGKLLSIAVNFHNTFQVQTCFTARIFQGNLLIPVLCCNTKTRLGEYLAAHTRENRGNRQVSAVGGPDKRDAMEFLRSSGHIVS